MTMLSMMLESSRHANHDGMATCLIRAPNNNKLPPFLFAYFFSPLYLSLRFLFFFICFSSLYSHLGEILKGERVEKGMIICLSESAKKIYIKVLLKCKST